MSFNECLGVLGDGGGVIDFFGMERVEWRRGCIDTKDKFTRISLYCIRQDLLDNWNF